MTMAAGSLTGPGAAAYRRRFLVLAIIAGLLIGALGYGLRQTTARFQLEGERHHAATWLLMQTEMELRHFADSLSRAAFADDARQWASLPAQLHGLRDRLTELAAVDTGFDNPALAGLNATLPNLLAAFADVEAALQVDRKSVV